MTCTLIRIHAAAAMSSQTFTVSSSTSERRLCVCVILTCTVEVWPAEGALTQSSEEEFMDFSAQRRKRACVDY